MKWESVLQPNLHKILSKENYNSAVATFEKTNDATSEDTTEEADTAGESDSTSSVIENLTGQIEKKLPTQGYS